MSNIYNPYDLEPFEPTHPGELLGDELEARGLTQRKFAETIGISCSVLNEVTRVRDNIQKSKEQKNIQPTKGGHNLSKSHPHLARINER